MGVVASRTPFQTIESIAVRHLLVVVLVEVAKRQRKTVEFDLIIATYCS